MPGVDESIPIVDLGEIGLYHSEEPSEGEWQRVAKGVTEAFKTIGFVYLTNHGISDDLVNSMFGTGATFFQLPPEEKKKYHWNMERSHGYVEVGRERLDSTVRYELREAFDMRSAEDIYPDDTVPAFKTIALEYLKTCQDLCNRLFVAIAIGLDLDRNLFLDAHKYIGKEGNTSLGRIIHYPPVPKDIVKETIRCGAHTDYGTLTLLFQDNVGGLNVQNCQGEWVSAENVPGAVLVNIGDLLQFWTSKKLVATEHKVVVPTDEEHQQKSRRSLVYFAQADDDYLVKPLDGSDGFEPITSLDYLKKRLNATYSS